MSENNNNSSQCKQLRYILDLNTKIELQKYCNDEQQKEIDELKKTLKNNSNLVLTSLIGVIMCLLGVIVTYFGK